MTRMLRLMCKGKIHMATVTEAKLHYVGSITVDAALLEAANILPYEIVQITSLANATRWKTYALPAERGSGRICLNGPPAHLFAPGDRIIILSMGLFDESEMSRLTPTVVFVDGSNRITGQERHALISADGEVDWIGTQPKQVDEA